MGTLQEIMIGCGRWSYDDWKGVLYPDNARPGDYLCNYVPH